MPIYKGPAHHRSMNVPHASITVEDSVTATTIGGIGTAVQVTNFDTNGPSFDAVPDQGEDHILISTTGTYSVSVSAAIDTVGGAGQVVQLQVQKNDGSSEIIPHINRNMAGGAGEIGSFSMDGLAVLDAGDTVELWIENETTTDNLLVESASLSVVQVG